MLYLCTVKTRYEYKRELFIYVCEKFKEMFAYDIQFERQTKRILSLKTKDYYIIVINRLVKTYILLYPIDNIEKKKIVVLGGHTNKILIRKFNILCRKGYFHGKIE
jgi:hypothetical protein